jgi:hypothetical protein
VLKVGERFAGQSELLPPPDFLVGGYAVDDMLVGVSLSSFAVGFLRLEFKRVNPIGGEMV